MRTFPKFLLPLLIIALFFQSCYLPRIFRYNFAGIKDYEIFDNKKLKASENPFYFYKSLDTTIGDRIIVHPKKTRKKWYNKESLNDYIDKRFPIAMIVVRNDTILYERYEEGFNAKDLYPSFSMIKSLGIFPLIGLAIEEGKIASIDSPIKTYLPNTSAKLDSTITIRHLLNMTSGIRESKLGISPFSSSVRQYYSKDLSGFSSKITSQYTPGEKFFYSATSSTYLLGEILRNVYKQPIEELYQEKIWQHIGADDKALWSLDDAKNGRVKAFCCFHTTIYNYARLARLFLNKGKWNNQQIIPELWMNEIFDPLNNTKEISPRIKNGKSKLYYSTHWFRSIEDEQLFKAAGFLSQHIIISPKDNTTIITFSKLDGMRYNVNFSDLYFDILKQL